MARKSLSELKKEQKMLSDLIREKESEIRNKALKKMGEAYIRTLAKTADVEKAKERIAEAGLTEDEFNYVEDLRVKNKRLTSSPTAPQKRIEPEKNVPLFK